MNPKDADTARRLGPSAWRDDWMTPKETIMDEPATDGPELTAADRAILAAQNGERCIHVDPDRGRQCALTAGHDTHIADGGGWTLLPGEDDVLPARASQAATATHSTGDDVGAAHDPHKPAAGRTEPQPVDLAFAALGKWFHPTVETTASGGHTDDPNECGICWEAAEAATAAAIPAIRAAVLDQARTELTTTRDGITWDDDIADSARAAYSDAINRLDAIARGGQ